MSSLKGRVWAALLTTFLLEGLSRLSSFFILALSNRSLGIDRFGWTQLQLNTMEVLQQCIVFGYTYLVFAEMNKVQGDRQQLRGLFSQILGLRLVQSLFLFSAYLILQVTFHKFDPALSAFMFLTTFSVALDANWFVIFERKLPAFNTLLSIFKLAQLLTIYFFIKGPEDSYLLLFALAIPNCLFNVGSFIYTVRVLGVAPPHRSQCAQIFRKSLPFASIVLLGALIDRIDIFTLNSFYSEELGAYTGASRLVQSLVGMMSVLIAPLHMEITRTEDDKDFVKQVQFAFWILASLALPLIAGGPFVSSFVTGLVLKNLGTLTPTYFSLLLFHALGSVFIYVFGFFVLMTKSKPWKLGFCYLFGILIFTLSCLIFKHLLMPGLAIAVAVVLGKMSAGLLAWIFSRSDLPDFEWKVFYHPLLAALAMAVGLWLLPPVPPYSKLIFGALLYLVVLSLFMRKEIKTLLTHKFFKKALGRS